MKTNLNLIAALAGLLALGTTALVAQPQDNGRSQDGPGPGGPPMRGHRPPAPAIVRALDVNHDGVIDAQEIANASVALKSLDKNGDGKLTPDEFMGPRPPRPFRPDGPGRGPPEYAAQMMAIGRPARRPAMATEIISRPARLQTVVKILFE